MIGEHNKRKDLCGDSGCFSPLLWNGPWGTCRWCYPANTLRLGNLLPRYYLELIQINRATKLDKLDFLIGHNIVVLKHVACLKLAIWIWNRAQKRIGEKLNLTIEWVVWCASNWFRHFSIPSRCFSQMWIIPDENLAVRWKSKKWKWIANDDAFSPTVEPDTGCPLQLLQCHKQPALLVQKHLISGKRWFLVSPSCYFPVDKLLPCSGINRVDSIPPTPRKRKKNISKYLCDDKFLPQSPQTRHLHQNIPCTFAITIQFP